MMNGASPFQSEMSNHFPECNNSDKLICKNLVKDIDIDIVNSKIKMEEEYLMANSINTLNV